MIRAATLIVAAWATFSISAAPANAQVFVGAPFVRVETGSGVYVRAPFVRLWIPNGPPPAYFVAPPPRPVEIVPPPPVVYLRPNTGPLEPTLPQPQQLVPAPNGTVPAPLQVRYLTLGEFARTFQPRGGQFDVTLLNPLTQQPVEVRFSLPDGAPRRVIVDEDEIEFRYGVGHFVRIGFTRYGANVVSR